MNTNIHMVNVEMTRMVCPSHAVQAGALANAIQPCSAHYCSFCCSPAVLFLYTSNC